MCLHGCLGNSVDKVLQGSLNTNVELHGFLYILLLMDKLMNDKLLNLNISY